MVTMLTRLARRRFPALQRPPVAAPRSFATASNVRNPPPPQSAPNNYVRLVEVGPRDGLQNEKKTIPLKTKIELIHRLAKTGLSAIEAGAFVSPKWVPQMQNSSDILTEILNAPPPSSFPVTYSFLAPNAKGMTTASSILASHPNSFQTHAEPIFHNNSSFSPPPSSTPKPALEIAVFAAATETFSQKNLNSSISASLANFRTVIQEAKALGLRARAYISVVLGCPFEGYDVDPHRVAEMGATLLEMGADEISLGDTTGMGTAPRTQQLLRCMAAAGIRHEDMAMHFHDTYGQALVNTAVALEHGIRTFDSSVGGLGGCPYSPGATGNVATENMVYFLEGLGMGTGVDLDAVADTGEWVAGLLGKGNESCVGRAVLGARVGAGKG